ncbi:MAG: PQQ-dependent sugar dehydrogenase [Bacillota bacterium]|nr:PQQ-dependent sugar dehydrogenase [Bacillota bacterium]
MREEQSIVPPINTSRKVNPNDILLPPGYSIDVFAEGLDTPINMIITEHGEILVADAGILSGSGKVLKLIEGKFEVIADGFNPPLTGINYYKGNIYVSHRGFITVIESDGTKQDILSGLPSLGDHHNNQVIFGSDGKMYFGQGTATNSGVVGEDNEAWVKKYPFFHDYPGSMVILKGQNFKTKNFNTASETSSALTGAYSPFGVSNMPNERIKGITRASGSILRANLDGSNLELVAWGLRNPFRIKFDRYNRLFCSNLGADERGSRPLANCPDEFQLIVPGAWYGWPDYSGGLPVTLPMFKPEGKPQPEFLLAYHPMNPPSPYVSFANHSSIMGFDFNYNSDFGPYGDAYIAEYGSGAPKPDDYSMPKVGHRVSRINMHTGEISNFAINHSGCPASYNGGGGLERPIDVLFDFYGSMYVVDFGMAFPNEPYKFMPKSGVIWKITKD